MQVQTRQGPAFGVARLTLGPNEPVKVEGGAMMAMSGGVTLAAKAEGGVMKSLKRAALGGESFFVNDFTTRTGGQVGLAAVLPGDLVHVDLTGQDLMVQSGSWIASDTSVDVDSKWGGAKGFFSGAGLVLLRCSGQGDLLVSSYGGMRAMVLAPGEKVTIDTGHIVAFDSSVQYTVRKAGSWKTTFLSGEGLVTDFTGPGRVWLQTRNSSELVMWLDARLPRQTTTG